MRKLLGVIVLGLLVGILGGCRTTEANYRAAYEKAKAAKADEDPIDSTIYGYQRRQMTAVAVQTPDGTVEVQALPVRLTTVDGVLPQQFHRYNVVVAQFKQIFNARSMRERLVDELGYPGAIVLESAEPYYYVAVRSVDTPSEANAIVKTLIKEARIPMKEPCPFILDAIVKRRK